MRRFYRLLTGALEWPADPMLRRLAARNPEKWGGRRGDLPAVTGGAWVHAASAGEVRGIVPLARRLAEAGPTLVTAHTDAGAAVAGRLLPGTLRARAPLDFPGAARRGMRSAAPRLLILAETELWPNLLEAAAERGVAVALVNARISDRSIGRYRTVRPLVSRLLARFEVVAAQSAGDAERFVLLGARPGAVRVTGSMKHDVTPAETTPAELPWGGAPVVVAGSLRDREEEALAEALSGLARGIPDLRIVAAPRHLHRRGQVGRAFHQRGFRVSFRSLGGPAAEDQVLVLDTMGELPRFYARARVAFVGGTWLPFGGHNLAEPAALGVPVVHGPFVANCRLEAEALARAGASREAATVAGLSEALRFFLIDPEARVRASDAARQAVAGLSGATGRTEAFLREAGLWPAGR